MFLVVVECRRFNGVGSVVVGSYSAMESVGPWETKKEVGESPEGGGSVEKCMFCVVSGLNVVEV